MARDYLRAYHFYLDVIEPLGDAERGRLFTAMLTYDITGEAPQLGGNEKFIFPMIRSQIDADKRISAVRAKSRDGKKQTITNQIKTEQTTTNENKTKQNEAKNSDLPLPFPPSPPTPPLTPYPNPILDDTPKEEPPKGGKKKAPFRAPTVEEVRAYCQERGNGVDPCRFVDFYTAKGWKVGNQGMKDWKAAVRTWERRDKTGNVAVPSGRKTVWCSDYDSAEGHDRLVRDMTRLEQMRGENG